MTLYWMYIIHLQGPASAGKPEISAAAIPALNSPAIVATQTADPISAPTSERTQDVIHRITGGDPKTSANSVLPSVSSHLWQMAIEVASSRSLQISRGKYSVSYCELGTAHQENKDGQL